jgi:lipoprotein NlpD
MARRGEMIDRARASGIAATSIRIGMAALVCIIASGCYGPPVVPVSERTTTPPPPEKRVVRHGDTLYNIAWENDLDFRNIAAWNNLSPPFVIHPGQSLRLRPPTATAMPIATAPQITEVPAQPAQAARSAPAADTNDARPSVVTAPAKPPPAETPLPAKVSDWSWPASGEVVARFSASGDNKGVNIAGREGSPVRAAAPGEVVYAGNGLRGYGQLTIIKHSDEFLSAYAHQRKMLIAEGDTVNSGQVIGEMGASGTNRTMLHFEIRRHGQPVDPMKYLPARRG